MFNRPWQRALFFFASRILMLIAVIFLLWYSFSLADQMSHVYLIVNDGMVARAEYIIYDAANTNDSTHKLYDYFMPDCIAADALLQSHPYANFSVSNYDYAIETSRVSVRPGSTRATCEITELVSSISATATDASEGKSIPTPQWEPKHYRVKLVRSAENRWYINELIELPNPKADSQSAS